MQIQKQPTSNPNGVLGVLTLKATHLGLLVNIKSIKKTLKKKKKLQPKKKEKNFDPKKHKKK